MRHRIVLLLVHSALLTAAYIALSRTGSDSRPLGSLDKGYIQEQIRDIVPLIQECYELALDTKPDLQGRVVVEIKLIGEEDIGGLIESSLVVEDESDVTDPMFLECVRETMYAVQLDAPEGGGSVVIKYPLNFASPPTGDEGASDVGS